MTKKNMIGAAIEAPMPPLINSHSGNPAMNIITSAPKLIASAVPRSGCNITRPAGIARITSGGTIARQPRTSFSGNIA